MKIIINDDINMIIFLNNAYLKIDELIDSDELEEYFKELFLILKNVYDIKINGYYNIDVYIDKKYGVVLELNKEELEYIDYYDNQVDMRIVIHDSNFLYIFTDYPFNELKDKLDLYLYRNKIYGNLKYDINDIEMGKLLENSELLYKDCKKILKYGKRLEVE